nr:MAG TPA: crystallin beta/gamma motif-containing protein [Caudoviricetes sp.]
MADYTFDTSGDMSDALKITPVKEQTQAMITPSAEETAERHEAEAQEAAANDEKIGEIIASGRPVMRKIPDLLTTPTITGNLNPPEPQEKPEWQKAAEWVVDSARDIWRNLFNENAQVLKDADTYAPMLGVSPQYMVDHPELLEETKKRDTLLTINDFLPGNNWYSPETLDKYYPELAKFRQENPVGAALALRNHRDLNDTRSIFERIGDAFNSAGELFADAFNSGSDMVKLYDAQMKAVNGEELDTVKPEVDEITQRLKAYQEEDRPTSALGKIVYDTVQQLTIYGTQGLRALQYVPKGMALAMATATPAAAAAGPETLGAGSAAILAAAGATGAAWGLRTGLYNEISKQSMADRYWQMAQQQSNGKPLYSRANMLTDSAVVGALNGAVELGLLEFGYGPIKAAFGKDAAKSLLTNAAAQRDVVNQGKLALAKIAALAGAKQYARGTLSELTEEGVQSVIGDVATNVEYGIHHKGSWNTVGDVLNNAVDAMVEAVPAALGMGAMGTGMHTVGHYNAMRNIASLKVDSWREEYQRNVEKQMITDLVANKSDNKLATDSPSTYQTVIQSQAEQHDMGTIYTDAQELARTPEGVNVLNDLVKRDIVTPEQVDTAVQNGMDLEIKTGVFAQRADESFDTNTLMDASTMNQGGTHLAALRERKQRMDALAQELRDIANDKSDAISEEIMQEHFKDADDIEQDAARDVVYRNPYDLQSSYKEALKDARKQYEDAVNFKYYWTYKPQGVSIIVADTEGHDNVQTGRGYRMSNNEPWYSDMYKEYGGKATKEQMLDVAYKNERAELAASSPELLPQWDANVEAAKQRYETLRDMGEKFEELSHSDYALRKTFSKEGAAVYQDAVKTFQQGNQAVSQAAKENAYLYARMAERWAQIRRDYGDTAYTAKDFDAAHPVYIGGTGSDVQFGQGKIRGAFDANSGAIHLFDAADQSSFIHESAHMYLMEMERMVQEEGAPKQLVEDWHTIRDWASYADGRLDDYKGTILEKEFAGYEVAIRKARESGDAVAIKATEERWMQERFARAFERYIAEGKAPVKELQGPFRRFKKWLIGIYRDLRNLGKEPTDDVRRTMERMVASDDEIETWARIRELDAWNRKGFSGDLSGSEGTMIHQWAEKIKEQAKEKLLAQYEEEARQRDDADRQQGLEEERIAYQKQLCAENPIYQYENIYNNMPEARAGILAKLGYADDAEFEQALKAAGGSLEERTDQYVESIRKTYEEDMAMTPDMIRAEADEMLASTNGQMALNQLEAAAMRRKMNGYIAECVKALREVSNVSGTDAQIAAQLRKILGVEIDRNAAQKGALKDSILSKNQQIKELKKQLADTKEKDQANKKENARIIKGLKDSLNDVIHGLNQARDMVQGSDMAMLRLAREEMDAMKVSEATTWRHYEIKAKAASHRADQYMSAGSFEQAVMEKANAQKFYAMARAAKDNADYIRRAMAGESGSLDMNGQEIYGIKGILKQLGRADHPVRMGPHARYFIQHLAYNLGMTDRDGRPPLDDKGNPVPLNWAYIYRDLSPDYATGQNTAPKPDELVAPWIRAIVDGKDRIQYDKDLTMAQFRDINEAIRAVNKVSRRDYEANTLTDTDGSVIAISDAAARLVKSLPHRENWDAEQERNDQNRKGRGKEMLSDALLSLTKIETLLRNMGDDWMQFIYKPIDRASRRELTMQQEACREFARIYHMYSNTEWRKMRSQKLYAVGSVERFTKEQLLVMALNWGNQEGRQRVLDEANRHVKNEAQKANEATIEDIFSRALSNKDLDFLEAIWSQLEQYWPERNKVQERLYGSGMGRVRAKPYTINGRKVSGGYYPIVYDPQLTTRTNEMELDDIVKTQLSGSSTMGIGMGSTKKRVKQVKNQILYKSLDVWPSAVNEAIHHICMREAVTDVYKLISHPDVEAAVQENYGMKTYASIKQWAKDCWKTDVQKTDKISRMLENMRRNTTFAVMAYRNSTAILNGLNILPMMNRIGVWNTVKAMVNFGIGFYKGTPTYNRNRRFVMEHSPFMADRINTIDKDMQQKMRLTMPKNTSRAGQKARIARDALNRYGYFFITETDLMCSLALWKYQYEESLRQQIDAGKTDEKLMRDQALFEADQAVRDVLGSGMVKDQAELQRKNGLVAQITPFYSYCNTVMNALIDAGYKWKSGNRLAMFNAMLYWIVLNSVFEQLYRSVVSGDDLDKLLKKMGVKFMTNTVQGIPVVRDAAEIIGNHMFGLPNYDSSNVLAVSAVDELMKASKAAASKNQDATDVARAANRALNRFVGLPDTLTDGFWSLMRFSMIDTDRSLAALANAVIFDRRYKTAKERTKENKSKKKGADKQ